MEKISICITYFNQEQYVKNSIESVLSIEFPLDFEILIGDDGSTDNTLNIIKEYQQKYPQKIKVCENKNEKDEKTISNASANRLRLAQQADGDYIIFLDGDDFYCNKDFITLAVNKLNENKNLTCCGFNFKYLYQDGKEEIFNQPFNTGYIQAQDYIKKGYYIHSGAIVFKNILKLPGQIDLLKKVNVFDDNVMTVYNLQYGDLYYFNIPIYVYRQSNDSLWNSFNTVEQNFLNATDYKTMLYYNPKHAKEILKRQYKALSRTFKKRKVLKKDLFNKWGKYVQFCKNNNDKFLLALLNWNALSLITKFKVHIYWRTLKLRAKIIR